MKVVGFILMFFLICLIVGVLYCCVAISKNKDKEIYDDRWIGSLTLVELFNQKEHKEQFFCENHYEHNAAVMHLVISHKRPPSAYEAEWDGVQRKFERAKVIELEGRYFWQDLSQH